jgi:tetratricopeptide (TPR) repeat protein
VCLLPCVPPAMHEVRPTCTQPQLCHARRFADAWRRRGQARAAAGDAEGALSDIRHCQSLLPLMGSDEKELSQRRAELQAEAATLLHRLGDYQAAVVELEQSLAVIKDNAQVGAGWGSCWAADGAGALDLLSEAAGCQWGCVVHQRIAFDACCSFLISVGNHGASPHPHPSRLPQAWHLLGVCHAVMGHIPEALAAYNTTLELLPRSPDVWLNVARALKGAGRMRESEEALLRALEVDGQGRPKDNRRWGGAGLWWHEASMYRNGMGRDEWLCREVWHACGTCYVISCIAWHCSV